MSGLYAIFEFLINRPLILLALMTVPLLFAWFTKKCFPTRRMLVWMLIPVSLSMSIAFLPQICRLYTSPSPRGGLLSRMPSSA